MPTDYGYAYAGIRDMGAEGTDHVRLYHWVMPWNQIRQTGSGPYFSGHMWVPIDDATTMVYNWDYLPEGREDTTGHRHHGRDRRGSAMPSSRWARATLSALRLIAQDVPLAADAGATATDQSARAEDADIHGHPRASISTRHAGRAWAPSPTSWSVVGTTGRRDHHDAPSAAQRHRGG